MVKEIKTIEEFKDITSSQGLVIIDYWASWCMPCKMFAKVLEKFAENEDYSDVTFVKVNVEEAEDLAGSEGVRSLPTIRAYKAGSKVAEQIGLMDKEAFKTFIESNRPAHAANDSSFEDEKKAA
ncbi:MAG: thioredoxin [Nanoarchaeales archaeon]|nr:thioredoxin [Nanoarchaeales archaeon]